VTQTAPARIRVREATAADIDRVAEMRLSLVAAHAGHVAYGPLRRNALEIARDLTERQFRSARQVVFLAVQGRRIVGMLRCVDAPGHRLFLPARHGYVTMVFVEPDARRRGVLRALLDHAVRWCKERGLDQMRLHNAADNPLASAAWESLGFRVVEQARLKHI
jgi:ribosomal protein S18 acetylase RimI-like enzyme